MIPSLGGDLSLFALRNIYFTKFKSLIRYAIFLCVGESESVKLLKIQKGFFVQLKGCMKETLVGQYLKSLRFSQLPHYISLRC